MSSAKRSPRAARARWIPAHVLGERLLATDVRNPAPGSAAVRSVMLANKGRGTSPERALARELRALGLRGYRLNRRVEGIRPDIVFGPAKLAVFVHGCFWHACPECALPLPRANRAFWRAKFRRNRTRDMEKRRTLEQAGWRVVEVWTHELVAPGRRAARLAKLVQRQRPAV